MIDEPGQDALEYGEARRSILEFICSVYFSPVQTSADKKRSVDALEFSIVQSDSSNSDKKTSSRSCYAHRTCYFDFLGTTRTTTMMTMITRTMSISRPHRIFFRRMAD